MDPVTVRVGRGMSGKDGSTVHGPGEGYRSTVHGLGVLVNSSWSGSRSTVYRHLYSSQTINLIL